MKRHVSLNVPVVVAFLLVSSLATAKTTLVHYAYTGHGQAYREFIEAAKLDFQKANPDIAIDVVEGNDYTKALTMAIGGVGPDVLDMSTNLAFSYFDSGMLCDLTPLMSKDKEFRIQEFIPAALVGYQARGATFGLPSSIYQILCFYNRDLFLQAGVKEPSAMGSSWTWEAALAAGKRLTRDRDGDGEMDQWGVNANWEIYRWPVFAHQAGGLLFDRLVEPTKPTFDSPAGRAGLQFLASLWAENAAVPASQIYSAHLLFYNGQIGFSLVDGPSSLASIPANNNDQFEWDVVQLPKGPVHNGTYLIMNGFQIAADSPHVEEAWRWLKFLVSRERLQDFMIRTGRTPARSALLREIPKTLEQIPNNLQAVSDAVLNPNSQPPYLTPIYSKLNGPSAQAIRPVLLGEKSVVNALQELDTVAAALLSDLRKQ